MRCLYCCHVWLRRSFLTVLEQGILNGTSGVPFHDESDAQASAMQRYRSYHSRHQRGQPGRVSGCDEDR